MPSSGWWSLLPRARTKARARGLGADDGPGKGKWPGSRPGRRPAQAERRFDGEGGRVMRLSPSGWMCGRQMVGGGGGVKVATTESPADLFTKNLAKDDVLKFMNQLWQMFEENRARTSLTIHSIWYRHLKPGGTWNRRGSSEACKSSGRGQLHRTRGK